MTRSLTRWGAAAIMTIVCGSWAMGSVTQPKLLGPGDVNDLPSKPANARIAYGSAPEQFGDLRLPAGKGPFPLAIVIHGGCFLSKIATLQNTSAMSDALRDAGLATWNVEYRRIGDAGGGWPGTFQDVGLAADYVRTLAKQHPIDSTRVISVGHSAGAVLALWLGAREKVPNGSPLYVREPLRLRTAVGMGADGDLPPIAPALEKLCGSKAADIFLEKPPSPVRLAQANPADMLPFATPQLLISGNLDPFEPPAQKSAYMARIRKAGSKVDELTFENAGHFEVVAPTSTVWPAVRDAILRVAGVTFSAQQPPPLPPVVAPMPAILKAYTPITAERLRTPADADWPMIRRSYDGWGYSPLDQITPANVSRLEPAWVFSTGVSSGHEAAPLVSNGVMFFSTPSHRVVAIDAKTGVLLWRYLKETAENIVAPHPTSRGVALFGDKVFFAANDAVLVALNARTGEQVWTATVAENKAGYYMTLAPLVADGKVMVGASGGELGVRGFIAAYDPETGRQLWRTYTVPAPGEPGSETWPKGDQWKNGGAPVWVTGNYDPQTNVAYWGTGNGGPWMGDQRPGDNLYATSTVAIDVATGRIKGHFQYVPNDSWDWDEVSPPLLIDYQRQGRTIKGLVNVARSGYLWFLERSDGPINFVEGTPFVKQNVFRSLDPKTGRPDVDPARKPGTGKTADFCPSHWGGKNWPPAAFSPKTRMIYIPANENLCGTLVGRPATYTPGSSYTGATSTLYLAPGAKHIGEVQAWNVDTGQRVWTHTYGASANWGPMLATGGGLVFSGGTNDRKFHAFDAATGKLVWEFPTNSGITGQPSSFMIDGKQYIAVLSGWGVDARAMQARLNRLLPGDYPEVPEGGAVWVFAVK